MTNANEKILQLKNVRLYFSSGFGKRKVVVKAVHNISFDVYKGEVFGLVGESGCGKTTTGRAIIKLYNLTDGQIYFKGKLISEGNRGKNLEIKRLRQEIKEKIKETNSQISELKGEGVKSNEEKLAVEIGEAQQELKSFIAEKKAQISELKKQKALAKRANVRDPELMSKMQMIFQDPIDSLNPRMTVKEIISEGLKINGIRDKEFIDKEVNRALELVGLLPDHANRYPHEFSGGQRQRIGIARALIVNPELIIADEPISALDVSIQAQIINLLNDLRKKFGLTILFIAHNLSVVKFFCDRIAVMYYGRIVEIATSDELFKHPLHPYTKALLSAVPMPDPDYEKTRRRITYNPSLRKFTVDKPKMVEIYPGHFVYASEEEVKAYRKELNLE
ncbi:MAG TPA: ATP-binding cassette domain-containing protein [Bacilli bacterium]|jgi:oligopeptide transport system ATP-binding protein|nr:ATP-binding cassette domain-containing protein [Acholeplasmataceae bacterium]HOA78237.1 ATP-binding cassette domain-containing protein [Bacilli bacterium]HPZ26627.1 ATP-binding cassette domain-containing protein [Bacilli bacterium]HQC88967.1 ATP-binding cassette domain-containing protein [Bacilli bacterium]